jgi:hypothetical protein
MSSQLQKIQITYDQTHDRLVLIIATQDMCEYCFWITRRMLRGVWDIMQRVKERLGQNIEKQRQEVQQAAKNVHQEKPQPAAAKYGMRVSRRPLGEEPGLLQKLTVQVTENRMVHFRLEDLKGHNIEFTGDGALFSGLVQAIQQSVAQADWNLDEII